MKTTAPSDSRSKRDLPQGPLFLSSASHDALAPAEQTTLASPRQQAASGKLTALSCLSSRQDETCLQDNGVLAESSEQAIAPSTALGWNDLPVELQTHIADILPKTAHRAALSRVNRNTRTIVAHLLIRDSLTEQAQHVTDLKELQAILGPSTQCAFENAAPQLACLADLGYSLRPQTLTVLASRLQFIPAERYLQAFELIRDHIQELPQHLRSLPFLRLSYEIGQLPNQHTQLHYQAFFAAAEDAYCKGHMTPLEYSKFLGGAACSLACLPNVKQPMLLEQFKAALARLPKKHQALPTASLGYQLGNLARDMRQAVYWAAWAITQHIVDPDKAHALLGLACALRYLPEAADRFQAFTQLLQESAFLQLDEQGKLLERLSTTIETLPEDKRVEGFEKILGAIHPMHDSHYQLTLQHQARNIALLPVAHRASHFDQVMMLTMRNFKDAGKAMGFTALAHVLTHLSAAECVDRCVDLAEAIMPLNEPHRGIAHRALLEQFPDLTLSEQNELTIFFAT